MRTPRTHFVRMIDMETGRETWRGPLAVLIADNPDDADRLAPLFLSHGRTFLGGGAAPEVKVETLFPKPREVN